MEQPSSSEKKCESIFYNLLECHRRNGDQNILATSYLREFSETERCDTYHDFSSLREDIKKRLGPETSERIDKCEETEKDFSVATQVCLHYHRWHEKHLLGCIDLLAVDTVPDIRSSRKNFCCFWDLYGRI